MNLLSGRGDQEGRQEKQMFRVILDTLITLNKNRILVLVENIQIIKTT